MKKILVWGTGRVAEQVLGSIINCEIIGFIETEKKRDEYRGKPVYSAKGFPQESDAILVANSFTDNVYGECIKNGTDMAKVCFLKKPAALTDIRRNLALAKEIMDAQLYEKVCYEFGYINDDWVGRDARTYASLNARESMKINETYNRYIYSDKCDKAGAVDSYFWQDLWAARKVYRNRPERHYDIGSRVDGFISHLLAFRDNIYLIDIRQLDREVDGLDFIRADATDLDGIEDNSIESLSALCSLEHFGLGRYGDAIDPEACYKCFDAIYRKARDNGDIYISVPVGREHIEFNAHRVFYAGTIVDAFAECELVEYSCTNDGFIEYDIDIHKYDNDSRLGGARFGLFHFRKQHKEPT